MKLNVTDEAKIPSEIPTQTPTIARNTTKSCAYHIKRKVGANGRTFGNYLLQFSAPDHTGAYKCICRSLETEDFATAKERQPVMEAEIRKDLLNPPDKKRGLVTVDDAVKALREMAWSLKTREEDAKPRTLLYYEERLKALVKSWPELPATALSKLNALDCKAWAVRFAAEYSPTAFNNTLFILKSVVELGMQEGVIVRDPLRQVQRRKVKQKETTLPTREQEDAILRALSCAVGQFARAEEALVRLSLYSGVRKQEAAGLEWRDADFGHNRLNIERQRTPEGKTLTPKNGKARSLVMNATLRAWLLSEYNRQNRPAMTARITQVFSCRQALQRACAVAKCAPISQHELRNLFITHCIQNRVDIVTIAAWVGHQDGGKLLLETYAKLIDDQERKMAALVSFGAEPVKEQPDETIVPMEKAG